MLGTGLLRVLSLIQDLNPSLLHEIFDIGEFALVLCAATLRAIPDKQENSFDARTCILRSIPDVVERRYLGPDPKHPNTHEFVGCFAKFFLQRAPSLNPDGGIVHTVIQLAAQDNALTELLRNHSDLVVSLCEKNQDVAVLFSEMRPVVAVRRLWRTHVSSQGAYIRFLDILAKHQSVRQLSRDLCSEQVSFLTDRRFYVTWSGASFLPYDKGIPATNSGLVKWFVAGFQKKQGSSQLEEHPTSLELEASRLLTNVIAYVRSPMFYFDLWLLTGLLLK